MNVVEAMSALAEGKKVRHKDWNIDDFYFIDENSVLKNNNGSFATIYYNGDVSNNGWELYQEPKQKKKLYQAVFCCTGYLGSKHIISDRLFDDEEHAVKFATIEKLYFVKLLEPAIEVDDEI